MQALMAAAPSAAGAAGAGAGAAGAAGASGLSLGSVMSGIQTAGQVANAIGPNSPFVTGDIGGMASSVQGLQKAGQAASNFFNPQPAQEPTTMGTFGLSPEEFGSLDPQIKQLLLKKALGR